MGKLIGYARVSTRGQQADRQIENLLAAGVRRDDLYVDRGVSGARESRPAFDKALGALETGDTLVIATLDRLGRSTQTMLTFAQDLRDRGSALRVLNLGGGDVDTSTPMGSMVFTVMAALAQMELDIKRERITDSAAEAGGVVSYSWVSVCADDWNMGLQEVLAWRTWMRDEHGIAKAYELHMTKFANCRGNPSTFGDVWNRRKANRSFVIDATFERFSRWSWMRAGTIFARTTAKREGYRDERARVYRELLDRLEDELATAGEWGIVYMDGDGTDPSYRRAHRDLDIGSRRILEGRLFSIQI